MEFLSYLLKSNLYGDTDVEETNIKMKLKAFCEIMPWICVTEEITK